VSEKNFWTLVRGSLPLKMYRVENKVMKGMPDIHYIRNGESGWIELKYLPEWPKTRVSIGLRQNQSLWLQGYRKKKGKSWILIRIGRAYTCLIDGKDAEKIHKRPSKQDFFKVVVWAKTGNMTRDDWDDLADVISSPLRKSPKQ